jgi:hypothetical protein
MKARGISYAVGGLQFKRLRGKMNEGRIRNA